MIKYVLLFVLFINYDKNYKIFYSEIGKHRNADFCQNYVLLLPIVLISTNSFHNTQETHVVIYMYIIYFMYVYTYIYICLDSFEFPFPLHTYLP